MNTAAKHKPRDKKLWDIHLNVLQHFLTSNVGDALHGKTDKDWISAHKVIFDSLNYQPHQVTTCANKN